jgi:hypothetical protein
VLQPSFPFAFKVRVESIEESREVQRSLFSLGCTWPGRKLDLQADPNIAGIAVMENGEMSAIMREQVEEQFDSLAYQEIPANRLIEQLNAR